jgi:hypothetical protein
VVPEKSAPPVPGTARSPVADDPGALRLLRHREALTVQPKATSFSDRLRLTKLTTFNDRGYEVASAQSKPAIDPEVNFDFNAAAITSKAEPQLDELGAALSNPQLKSATISKMAAPTASAAMPSTRNCPSAAPLMILPCGQLPPLSRQPAYRRLRETRPKNPSDLNAPESRRALVLRIGLA